MRLLFACMYSLRVCVLCAFLYFIWDSQMNSPESFCLNKLLSIISYFVFIIILVNETRTLNDV